MRHPIPIRIAMPVAALSMFCASAGAQPVFEEVTPLANPYFQTPEPEDFWINAVAPVDVDSDGDLDLAVLGFHVVYDKSVEDRLVILRNDGEGEDGQWRFEPVPVPLGKTFAGASDLAWGDFDNDGDDDLAVGSEGDTLIYRNDGGTLERLPLVLPGYYEDSKFTGAYDLRSLGWADVDNDGDLDLLVPSTFDFETFDFRTVLLRNGGTDGVGGWRFDEDTGAALLPTVHAQSAWTDDDGDGDLDLLLADMDPLTESGSIRRYDNDGGSFSPSLPLDSFRVEYGLVDWGDADGDGDFDILAVGNVAETNGTFATVLRIYDNTGAGYAPQTLIEAPNADWLDLHAGTWADYDSDGDVDLLVTGSAVQDSEIVGRSRIYANDGGGFAPLGDFLPAPVDSIGRGGTFTWMDIDGDGDLDYLVAGAYFVADGNGLVEARMHLYRNSAAATNAPPASPLSPLAVATEDGATLSWQAPVDDHTPADQLTYDLEIVPAGAIARKARRLPEAGNVSNATAWTVSGLPEGRYTWRVRAVDSAYNGGDVAGGTFIVGDDTVFANGFEPVPVD